MLCFERTVYFPSSIAYSVNIMAGRNLFHYEPLEARRNELLTGDSSTRGIVILNDDQVPLYPMNSREIMTILRRALLALLCHVESFRLVNPLIANMSLLIELKALQCYVFEVAQNHPRFDSIARHCFIPVVLRPGINIKSKTLAGMKAMISELMYERDSIEEIMQTFLSLEHWNTFEFYSLGGVICHGSWKIDPIISLTEAEAMARGTHPNTSRLSAGILTRYDPLSDVHLIETDESST